MNKFFFKEIKHYFSECRRILIDIIILVLSILGLGAYLNYIEATELLYKFSRSHETYNLDEIVLTIALSSFFFFFFILRRFFELKNLIKKANTDPFLGIVNRRKGSELILHEIDILENNPTGTCLIMFDIDDFKRINDTYGHDMGDYVLKEITSLIKNYTRNDDQLIRWGGEEFIVLCPKTDLNNAYILASRFKDTMQKHDFKCKCKITASFGVIKLVPNKDLRTQIDKVDANLYISKKNGKNIVT